MPKLVHRIFYTNVDGLAPVDIPEYMIVIKDVITTNENHNIRMAIKNQLWEDFWIPVRNQQTKIEIQCANLDKPKLRSKILRSKRKK